MELEEKPDLEGEALESVSSSASYIDLFKEELKGFEQVKEVHIPVEGYERSGVTIKYRLPEGVKELDMIIRNVERQSKDMATRNLNASMDTIIKLCEGIYVNPPDDSLPEPAMMDPDGQGYPITFSDDRIAAIIGLEGEATARAAVKKFFGGNEMAILKHADVLREWITNTKADVASQSLGESLRQA